MRDVEIQFGDIVEQPLRRCVRPDEEARFTVIPCGVVTADQVAVYVDLDAMRAMESHSQEDTRVELGGVLLGGQFEDEQGRPFVVVADCLRAEHYESTQGSFKFTHDSWSEITRQRADLPSDWEMVGWYHTHPGWGVFLSSMDEFICDHFFQRPLDLALVIDPCRRDRGWFQWTENPTQRLRRSKGFYLYASRHRRADLVHYRTILEGEPSMPKPSHEHIPWPTTEAASQTSFSRHERQFSGPWLLLAGMLVAQLLVLALLSWKVVSPTPGAANVPKDRLAEQVRQLTEVVDQLRSEQSTRRDTDAQVEILDRVVTQLGAEGPSGLVRDLERQQRLLDTLRDDARVYRELEQRVREENEALSRSLAKAGDEKAEVDERLQQIAQSREHDQAQLVKYAARIASLEEDARDSATEATTETVFSITDNPRQAWLWGAFALVGFLCGTLFTYRFARRENRTVAAAHERAEAMPDDTSAEAEASPTSTS